MRKSLALAGLLLLSACLLAPTAATAAEDQCPHSPDFSSPCPVLHFAPTYQGLNNHLDRLSPHETLPVKFVARVNHVIGNVRAARLIVRMPGRQGT